MIANFDVVKQQLKDLVEVVNGFKSEQVQLKIIECLLGSASIPPPAPRAVEPQPGATPKPTTKPAAKKAAKVNSGNKSQSSSKGPKKVIETLLAEGFFKSKRGVGAVVTHLSEKKATTLTVQTVATTLARLVQSGILQREKNADEQFEYYQQ